jgi:hypothetical protein
LGEENGRKNGKKVVLCRLIHVRKKCEKRKKEKKRKEMKRNDNFYSFFNDLVSEKYSQNL